MRECDGFQLKPCPFCGWSIVEFHFDSEMGYEFMSVKCCNCGALGGSARNGPKGKEVAADLWNKRVGRP